jgi:hypothetical protein
VRGELENFEVLSRFVDAERADWGACNAVDVIVRERTLEKLTHIAAVAAAKIPKGKGAKRDDRDISAEEWCAFMVRRAWFALRGEWLGSQTVEAWEACEKLWMAAGGKAGSVKEASIEMATPLGACKPPATSRS